MQNKGHLNHIEFIRAFAALSVAIFHFTHFSFQDHVLIASSAVKDISKFGAQGVEVFYVISGFIICYSLHKSHYKIRHYFAYLAKRFIRLLPPYFLTIALITALGYILCTYFWLIPYNIEWRNIFANCFFLVDFINQFDSLAVHFPDNAWINPIFETLKVEFQFYILIGLFFPLIKKNQWFFIALAIIALGIGAYTIPTNTVFSHSPYFILGMSAFYIREKGWEWPYIAIVLISLTSLCSFYLLQDLFAAILAFSLVLWLPRQLKFLNFTGRISYSYYLIHGLIGMNFLFATCESSLFKNYPYLMIIFAILLSWAGAFLVYFCIEKPSMAISKRIKYKP